MLVQRSTPSPIVTFFIGDDDNDIDECSELGADSQGVEAFSLATPEGSAASQHSSGSPQVSRPVGARCAWVDTLQRADSTDVLPWDSRRKVHTDSSSAVSVDVKLESESPRSRRQWTCDESTAALLFEAQLEAAALCANERFAATGTSGSKLWFKDRACGTEQSMETASTSASCDSATFSEADVLHSGRGTGDLFCSSHVCPVHLDDVAGAQNDQYQQQQPVETDALGGVVAEENSSMSSQSPNECRDGEGGQPGRPHQMVQTVVLAGSLLEQTIATPSQSGHDCCEGVVIEHFDFDSDIEL